MVGRAGGGGGPEGGENWGQESRRPPRTGRRNRSTGSSEAGQGRTPHRSPFFTHLELFLPPPAIIASGMGTPAISESRSRS